MLLQISASQFPSMSPNYHSSADQQRSQACYIPVAVFPFTCDDLAIVEDGDHDSKRVFLHYETGENFTGVSICKLF